MESHKQLKRSSSTVGAGNGRIWTEEEEQYLLQKRREKMPYKHIAAHLDKTDLACRLHYHHLTHGVNRRRKGGPSTSVSPRSSPVARAASLSREQDGKTRATSTEQLELPALIIPPSSVSLLPRPRQTLPFPSQVRLPGYQASEDACRLADSGLTIFTVGPASYGAVPQHLSPSVFPPQLDLSRLHSVYDAHRSTFWAAIAGDYQVPTSPVSLIHG